MSRPVGAVAYAARTMRRMLIVCLALVGMVAERRSSALASPGWSAPGNFPLPAKEPGSLGQIDYQIAYQAGGTATIAYLEVISLAPLQTVLHVGVLPPGGAISGAAADSLDRRLDPS